MVARPHYDIKIHKITLGLLNEKQRLETRNSKM